MARSPRNGLCYLSSFNIVNPSCNDGVLQNKRVLLEVFNIGLDAFFQVGERQKVDFINSFGNLIITRTAIPDDSLELFSGECEHTTSNVAENCNLAGAQEALGDNNTADILTPGGIGSVRLSDMFTLARSDLRYATGVADDMGVSKVKT